MPRLHAYVALLAVALLLAALAPSGSAQTPDDPPSVEIQQPDEGATVDGTLSVEGTASDNDGNVSRVEVRIDGGDWRNATGQENWTFSWDTTQHADGEHGISARAYDDESYSDVATRNVTVENGGDGGGQAPSVTIEDPPEGAAVNGSVDIRGTASDPDGNVSDVQIRVDDGFWAPVDGTADWVFSWDTANVEDGEHTITVRAADEHGAATEATLNVTVENVGEGSDGQPTVEVAEPEPNASLEGTTLIRGNASDPDGSIARVEVRIGDARWRVARGASSWDLRWNVSTVDPGSQTIHVRAVDGDGNQANASVPVEIEDGEKLAATGTSEPSLSLSSPEDDATVERQLELAGEVQGVADPDAVILVSYRIDDGSPRVLEVPGGGPFEETFNVTGLSPGEHELTVKAFHGDESSDAHTKSFEVQGDDGQGVGSSQAGVAMLVVGVLATGGLILWSRR